MYEVKIDYIRYLCDDSHLQTFLGILQHVKKVEGNEVKKVSFEVSDAPDYVELQERERVRKEECKDLTEELERFKKMWYDNYMSNEKLKKELSELKEKYSA